LSHLRLVGLKDLNAERGEFRHLLWFILAVLKTGWGLVAPNIWIYCVFENILTPK